MYSIFLLFCIIINRCFLFYIFPVLKLISYSALQTKFQNSIKSDLENSDNPIEKEKYLYKRPKYI